MTRKHSVMTYHFVISAPTMTYHFVISAPTSYVESTCDPLATCSSTVKMLNIRTPKKIWCNHPKIWTRWLTWRVMHPKDAAGIANSVDPYQTPPLGAVWSGSALFAQTYLFYVMQKLKPLLLKQTWFQVIKVMLQFDIIQRGDGEGERLGAREAHYIMMCKLWGIVSATIQWSLLIMMVSELTNSF